MVNVFTFNTVTELVCLVIAVLCLRKDTSSVWKSMMLYLLLVCVAEMSGVYFRKNHHPNSWIYNTLLIFEIGFISNLFMLLLNQYFNSRYLVLTGTVLLAVIYIYDVATHGIFKRHNLTNTVTAVVFIFYSLYYFYHLLKAETYVNLKYHPAFWWVTGVLFFYFGDTACNVFFPLLIDIPNQAFTYIYWALNFLLYACWSYSFICRTWQVPTSPTLL